MSRWVNVEIIIGLIAVLVGVVTLTIWIPNDIAGEAINYARRRYSIGDPFAPILISWLVIIAGAGLLLTGLFRGLVSKKLADPDHAFYRSSLGYMLGCGGLLTVALLVMRYAGPWSVDLFGPDKSYKLLVTTPPWHYLGYMMGAFILMATTISVVERRLRMRTVLIAISVPLLIALAYDLPFSLILPPNGRADAG